MKRTLGRTGITVGRIGLGCATFGREATEETCFEIMDYAVEHGVTLFDTAEAYGGGQARELRRQMLGVDDVREVSGEMSSSEKIIGRWLRSRGCRKDIVIVSKVRRNFTPEHVREALQGSLERLQTDAIDVYLYHRYYADVPLAESVDALDAVIKAGLTRAGGCSNYSGAQLTAAVRMSEKLGKARFEVSESLYNLALRDDFERDLQPATDRENVGTLVYSPLGGGFLNGDYTFDRNAIPRHLRFGVMPDYTDIYFTEQNFRRLAALQRLAQKTGIPAIKLAMSWVLQNPGVSCVLAGALTPAHLAGALEAQKLEFDPAWSAEIRNDV